MGAYWALSGPGVMATTDCRADHDVLAGRGVEFHPAARRASYGIEAILRDDPGNRFSFTQRKG